MTESTTTDLGQAATDPVAVSRSQLVIFSIAGEEYALSIACIQEVIRYTKPRSIISTDPWITGVVDLRGKIVPVCDLAARLGLTAQPSDTRKIVILETSGDTAGMIVDAVDRVIMIERSQLERPAAPHPETVDAIARIDDRLVVVLDARSLVSPVATTPVAVDTVPEPAAGATRFSGRRCPASL